VDADTGGTGTVGSGIMDTGTVGSDMLGSGIVGPGTIASGTVGSGMADTGVDSGILGSDTDYIGIITLAMFTTQQPRQCFNVTIIDDAEVEAVEDLFAALSLLPDTVTVVDPNRIIVDPSEATVSIVDHDVRKL